MSLMLVLWLFWPFFGQFEPLRPTTLDCAVLVPWWYGSKSPSYVAYRMIEDLNRCKARSDHALRLVLMPESTFCFDILSYQYFIPLWCENLDDILILFGTHEHHGDGAYNVVYGICNGIVQFRYRKQHLMPLVEYHPLILQWLGIKPFFEGAPCKMSTLQSNDDVIVIQGQKYQIFVCSELFFQAKLVKGYPVILLWNDSWLPYGWMKKVALWFIRYFAWKNHVMVWHVSTTGMTNIGKVDNL